MAGKEERQKALPLPGKFFYDHQTHHIIHIKHYSH
jgi:hypothetical protein